MVTTYTVLRATDGICLMCHEHCCVIVISVRNSVYSPNSLEMYCGSCYKRFMTELLERNCKVNWMAEGF
jgi:hypothetical protein